MTLIEEQPTDNPYFRLYDKLRISLASPLPSYQTKSSFISSLVSQSVGSFGAGYTGMSYDLYERAKFYFGNENWHYNFPEWCSSATTEEILFVVERTALAYEERKTILNGKKLNPFLRALQVMEDPRIKLGWSMFSNKPELHLVVTQIVCSDYELNPTTCADSKQILLSTLVSEMCRKKDSYLPVYDSVEIMIKAINAYDPNIDLSSAHNYYGLYKIFEAMPFDFDKVKEIIQIAAQIYEADQSKTVELTNSYG